MQLNNNTQLSMTQLTMTQLTITQLDAIKNRYPHFELSYESILHNKVPSKYELVFAIPVGKKCIAWYTFYKNENVLFLMELNKEKRIVNAKIIPCNFDAKLALGTIFYGSSLPEFNVFIIEDIHYYKGIHISTLCTQDKLSYIGDVLKNSIKNDTRHVSFTLPVFWYHNQETIIPHHINATIPYPVHHLQFRSLTEITPFLNHTNKTDKEKRMVEPEVYIPVASDFRKPQFKYPAVFVVKADIQFDIYRLFVYGKNNSLVYYNTAYIADYKTSVFMNQHFRNIKENRNLDYIEESDDEDDFQDVNPEKYVDLKKSLQMECIFHSKFKRWIPTKLVKNQRVVHITQLQYVKQDHTNNYSKSNNYSKPNNRRHNPYKSQSVSDMSLDEYIRCGPGKGVGITEPVYSEDQRKISRRHI